MKPKSAPTSTVKLRALDDDKFLLSLVAYETPCEHIKDTSPPKAVHFSFYNYIATITHVHQYNTIIVLQPRP